MHALLLKPRLQFILLTLMAVVFVCFKIPCLDLPFYWDESWVYGPAVRWMGENGPGLLPDALPLDYGRGHPLLFHFLGACWYTVFGGSLVSLHTYALSISVVLLISVFYIVRKLFNPVAAICCTLLVCLQPVFVAQSVLVLPEVLMSVFIAWGIYHYLQKKYTWYIVCASCAVLTKETALVLPLAAVLFETLTQIKNEFSFLRWIKKCLLLASPLLFFGLTLWLNYVYYGWFLFPEHKQSITNEGALIWKNLTKGYGAFLFIYQARNVLSAALILTALYFLAKKRKVKFNRAVWFMILFIVLFLIFSSFNFYSNRYILCIIVLFCVLISAAISTTVHVIVPVLVVLVFGFFSIREMQKDNHNDHHPGYKNYVLVREKVIDWCVKNNLREKYIATDFLTQVALTNPAAGYLNQQETFPKVTGVPYDEVNCIIVNLEKDEAGLQQVALKRNFSLVKQITYKHIVFSIYQLP